MGIINPYFPDELALSLRDTVGIHTFIETGTYYGGTAKWAAQYFSEVHTVERSVYLYNSINDDFSDIKNVHRYLGNSKDILHKIIKDKNENCLFWLDGHYSGGVTAGEDDPCPLLAELEIILQRQYNDIIFIDDARCYTGDNGFPSIFDIISLTDNMSQMKRNITIYDDHIYLFPHNEVVVDIVCGYSINRQISLWNKATQNKELFRTLFYNLSRAFLKKIKTCSLARRIYHNFFTRNPQ